MIYKHIGKYSNDAAEYIRSTYGCLVIVSGYDIGYDPSDEGYVIMALEEIF